MLSFVLNMDLKMEGVVLNRAGISGIFVLNRVRV